MGTRLLWELNQLSTAVQLAWPYKKILTVERWSDARSAGRVRCWQVLCGEPITGQQKVQLSSKTKHFAHLGMLIYACDLQAVSFL